MSVLFSDQPSLHKEIDLIQYLHCHQNIHMIEENINSPYLISVILIQLLDELSQSFHLIYSLIDVFTVEITYNICPRYSVFCFLDHHDFLRRFGV